MYTLVCVVKCGTLFKHYFLNFSFSIFLESPICLCFLESWRWCSRGLPEGHISSSILPLLRLDNITWSFLKLSDVYLLPVFNYFWQFFNLSSYTWFSTKIFNLSVNSENYILFYCFSIFLVFLTWKNIIFTLLFILTTWLPLVSDRFKALYFRIFAY